MACVTSSPTGECGPYQYAGITGSTGSGSNNTGIGNNMFDLSAMPSATQTLTATNPGSWQVVANLQAGNTGVISYPSLGQTYPNLLMSDLATFYGSFTEAMNVNSGTSAEAAFDIWFSNSGVSGEVMIQHDLKNRGSVTVAGNGMDPIASNVSFGGTGGVPTHNWNLGIYSYPGSNTYETIWQLADDSGSMPSGSVDILAMITWLQTHGSGYQGQASYLLSSAELYLIGYGWELCSTGGISETFAVSAFGMTYTLVGSSPPPPPPPPPGSPPGTGAPPLPGTVSAALLWGADSRFC